MARIVLVEVTWEIPWRDITSSRTPVSAMPTGKLVPPMASAAPMIPPRSPSGDRT